MDFAEVKDTTLQEIQAQIIDTLSLGHEELDTQHKEIVTRVKNVIKYLLKDGVHIYDPKNAEEFYDIALDLGTSIAVVDEVVADDKIKMYMTQAGITFDSIKNVPDEPEKKDGANDSGIMSKLFSIGRPKVRPSDPYESSVSEFNHKLHKKERLERFMEMYTHGVETMKIISNLPSEEVVEAMEDYKALHSTIFPNDLGIHIIMIHKLYVQNRKEKEKKDLLQVAISHQRDLIKDYEQQKFMQQPQ